jgi:ABC-type thiamine transport system substrate-binding protein
MNSLLRTIELWILFTFLLVISSCTIESAEEPAEKKLFIASDYLHEKDSILFKEFELEMNVDVNIIPIQTEELISRLKQQGLNSGIDAIMVKSLYDLHKLNKHNLLHPIYFEKQLNPEVCAYSSWKIPYVALGVDPFILAHDPHYSKGFKNYEDLIRFKFVTALGNSQTVPFLSAALRKENKVNGNIWIKTFCSNSIDINSTTDSLLMQEVILTTYSDFKRNNFTDNRFKNKSSFFPNSNGKGTLFNVRSISLVNQAQNYVNAKEFIFFYTKPKRNIELNKEFHTMSVFSNQKECNYYTISPEKLIPYYGMVDRVLKKLKNR